MFNGLKPIEPLTDNQGVMMDAYRDGQHVLCTGSAGTGKTFVALAMALASLAAGQIKRIIVIRSAVSTRDIGFLPGDEHEKMGAYEGPYETMVNEMFGRGDAYKILKTKDIIRFESTSFLRGSTWNDTTVVADEIQNFDTHEVNTVMTRVGKNTRIIGVGDLVQSDLIKGSGFDLLLNVATHMPSQFAIITMTHDDIVRSSFVKAWIIAVEKYSNFYKRGHG